MSAENDVVDAPEPQPLIGSKRFGSVLLPVFLFVLTALSTGAVGGVAFAATLMTIMLAHEMGHYIVARHHKLPASLPYFIPFPISLIGTLGAVISMRTEVATRNQLMDVGAAGPIVGFVFAVVGMVIGIRLSTPVSLADAGPTLMIGDSLLTLLLIELVGPVVPAGSDLAAHPVMVAAWAGFLITSVNLLPMGQLDGGHVLYASFPERAGKIARRVHRILIVLGVVGLLVHLPSMLYRSWGAEVMSLEVARMTQPLLRFVTPGFLILALLGKMTGLQHPPAKALEVPLTPWRRRMAWACVVIWLLTFMPNPAWEQGL